MQIGGGQTRAERQTRADQAAVVLHLITPDEQAVIRHPDALHGMGADQGAVEQGGDTRQHGLLRVGGIDELTAVTAPLQTPAQREGEPVRFCGVAHYWRDLLEVVGGGCVDKRFEHLGPLRAAVIISAPHRVRAERQRSEEPIGETATAAQVGQRRRVHPPVPGDLRNQGLHRRIGTVIHHDDVLHRVGLRSDDLQRVPQQLNAVVRDDHRRDINAVPEV